VYLQLAVYHVRIQHTTHAHTHMHVHTHTLHRFIFSCYSLSLITVLQNTEPEKRYPVLAEFMHMKALVRFMPIFYDCGIVVVC